MLATLVKQRTAWSGWTNGTTMMNRQYYVCPGARGADALVNNLRGGRSPDATIVEEQLTLLARSCQLARRLSREAVVFLVEQPGAARPTRIRWAQCPGPVWGGGAGEMIIFKIIQN